MSHAVLDRPVDLCMKGLESRPSAVGGESRVIETNFRISCRHFWLPLSRIMEAPRMKFSFLKARWEAETALLSSVTAIAVHRDYQQIIGMGPTVIPLILEEMTKKPGHWFWALKSITGEDPVLPAQRGNIQQMTEAWIRWGKEWGYLDDTSRD